MKIFVVDNLQAFNVSNIKGLSTTSAALTSLTAEVTATDRLIVEPILSHIHQPSSTASNAIGLDRETTWPSKGKPEVNVSDLGASGDGWVVQHIRARKTT